MFTFSLGANRGEIEKSKIGDDHEGRSYEVHMSSVRISIPGSREVCDSSGKTYTAYEVMCISGDVTWSIWRRYSECFALMTKIEREAIRLSSSFPKKAFGSLTESSKKQRQVQLDAYFRELSEFPLPGHLFEHLAVFLELNVYVACTSEQPAEVDVQLAEREARSAFSVTPAKCWNPSFMSADPLALNDEEPPSVAAGLVEGAEEVAGNKVICEASEGLLRHAPTLQFKHIGSVPAFLSQSSRRSYPPTGEGLRVSAHT